MANIELTYFAVGIDEYQARKELSWAVSDVRRVQGVLGTDPVMVGVNLTDGQLREHVKKLERVGAGDALVFYWAGHAESPVDLVLFTSDDADEPAGSGAPEVLRRVLAQGGSRASQQLYIFDVCHAGAAIDLAPKIHAIMAASQQANPLWVGILVSCRDFERAQDGAFGRLLCRLLEQGPDDPDLRAFEWSSRRRLIDGEALGNAVLKEWSQELDQRPDFERRGDRMPMIPNPLYEPDAPPVVVEHLLQAARGGADTGDPSAFTGRVFEVNTVIGWVVSGEPGLHVLSGPPGTGKSAILGRVVSLSNSTERARLLGSADLAHDDPGENSVAAHVHVRGMTSAQVAAAMDEQLEGEGQFLLRRAGGARNTHQLIGDLRQWVDAGGRVPCIAVDGLDEAGGEAEAIARDLLVELSRWATVVVSSREIPTEKGSLLDVLDPSAPSRTQGLHRTTRNLRSRRLNLEVTASDARAAG